MFAADMSDQKSVVVIDNGSCWCPAGFASEKVPRVVISSMVGVYKQTTLEHKAGDLAVGPEALKKSSCIMDFRFPIQNGLITDWDDMERVWRHILHEELEVIPQEHPVLLTEPPFNPQAIREKTTQVMFEAFNFPAMYLADQAVLSLYTSGHDTGIVLNSGEVTHVVPVYKGKPLPHAIIKMIVGGNDLSIHMWNLLRERGKSITTASESKIVNGIKQKLCYIPLHFNQEMERPAAEIEKGYELPDGQIVTIGNERFRCPEALFQPDLIGIECPGVHQVVCNSIVKCNDDIQKELFSNIVLSGGSTMFPGFADRLQKEVAALAPKGTEVKVTALPGRPHSAWIGGAKLASQPSFQHMCISKGEYQEYGPAIVHKKCFSDFIHNL